MNMHTVHQRDQHTEGASASTEILVVSVNQIVHTVRYLLYLIAGFSCLVDPNTTTEFKISMKLELKTLRSLYTTSQNYRIVRCKIYKQS